MKIVDNLAPLSDNDDDGGAVAAVAAVVDNVHFLINYHMIDCAAAAVVVVVVAVAAAVVEMMHGTPDRMDDVVDDSSYCVQSLSSWLMMEMECSYWMMSRDADAVVVGGDETDDDAHANHVVAYWQNQLRVVKKVGEVTNQPVWEAVEQFFVSVHVMWTMRTVRRTVWHVISYLLALETSHLHHHCHYYSPYLHEDEDENDDAKNGGDCGECDDCGDDEDDEMDGHSMREVSERTTETFQTDDHHHHYHYRHCSSSVWRLASDDRSSEMESVYFDYYCCHQGYSYC